MSSFGDVWGEMFDEDQQYKTIRKAKNEDIEASTKALMAARDATDKENEREIGKFLTAYGGQYKTASAQADQEIGVLDNFYNGNMERKLSDLRSNRRDAYRNATDRAVAGINRNRSLGFLGGDTPNNSYQNRMAMGLSRDAEIGMGLDDANQEKADLNYLTGNQVSLSGKRGQIKDSALARLLYPSQVRNANLAGRTQSLAAIDQIDKSNMFYGLAEDKSQMDRITASMNALGKTVMEAYSIYSGITSGGGGAKPPPKDEAEEGGSNGGYYDGPSGGSQGPGQGSGEGASWGGGGGFGGYG